MLLAQRRMLPAVLTGILPSCVQTAACTECSSSRIPVHSAMVGKRSEEDGDPAHPANWWRINGHRGMVLKDGRWDCP